jgi:NTE family protein
MKLGLSLSGGGFRALGFHLGVLARLAEENRLEEVGFLSTVSGGSLCVGLVYALNNFNWPTSQDYLKQILPQAREYLRTTDLEMGLIHRLLRTPWRLLDPKANMLSYLLQEAWGINIRLDQLPPHPRWMINATCYETGKNWRFERFRMGDYLFGYTWEPDYLLSDAIAASAGFPGLVGPMVLKTQGYQWFCYEDDPLAIDEIAPPEVQRQRKTVPTVPVYSKLHLWDGGVYDNHGLEGLHDFVTGWKTDLGFLIVSDAAGRPHPEGYRIGVNALMRIITGILMDQVRSLRSRAIIERLVNHHDPGVFLQIGNSCRDVLSSANRHDLLVALETTCLNQAQTNLVAEMATRIYPLTRDECELLIHHGFEVTDYTLLAYHSDKFKHIAYKKSP